MARKVSDSDTAAKRIAAVGLALFIVVVVVLALALFNRSFDRTVPLTVESNRAGLVMESDASVRSRGVQIGHVVDIREVDGRAVLDLEVDPGALDAIPANSPVQLGSNTVFGSKSVDFVEPDQPASTVLQAGATVESTDVTVEMNTLFEELTELLQATEPERLNATLGALATAFDGRGEPFGETIENLNAYLSETINPNLETLQRDLEAAGTVTNVYADATPDLMRLVDSGTDVGNNLLRNQEQFEQTLLSVIGTGETGKVLLDENADQLVKAMRDLRMTTSLVAEYSPMLSCLIVGLNQNLEGAKEATGEERQPGLAFRAGFQQGARPYTYPDDLPKVNASTGPNCYGLPVPEMGEHAPFMVSDVGTNVVEGMPNVNFENSDPLFGPLPSPGPGLPEPPTLLQVMLGETPEVTHE